MTTKSPDKSALTNTVTGRKKYRPVLPINEYVINKIKNTIGVSPIESGGMLGGDPDSGYVTEYHFDATSHNTGGTYTPDAAVLNHILDKSWEPKGKMFIGFIHSHPGSFDRPSYGDCNYARKILTAIDRLETLWLLILTRNANTINITAWAATLVDNDVSVVRGIFMIIPKAAELKSVNVIIRELETSKVKPRPLPPSDLPPVSLPPWGRDLMLAKNWCNKPVSRNEPIPQGRMSAPGFGRDDAFIRVRSAYDLERMAATRIISVGAGGAAEFLEQMARAGVGSFVLIDPDTVSLSNIATQQVYRRDLGKPKVVCIAERIHDINPAAEVITHKRFLNDFSDDAMRDMMPSRENALLCGFTDSFHAQARVNRLALKFGVPALFAQVYREGRGAEVIHTYPGVTPACLRCICSSRYKAHLTPGFDIGVGSDGTPIFATSRLNALKGFAALGIIHHGGDHPRWGGMLGRLGARNLAVIRMDPDFGSTIGISMFDSVFAGAEQEQLFFDETIWRPQRQESPETGYAYRCPDCGGTGDLRDAVGVAKDTLATELTETFFEPEEPVRLPGKGQA